ncbi:glycosyltransferase family 4 protein [Rhodoferax sp.]|uniref:glycosyltransferase family 4 protein n=1 Tax=Rhodoferax sp. TaxID=50421 RepID=UPI00271A62C9|nr:glycosyltransferase family 4 protein [Rhodoferax sp.]MDO9197474.1 glycosyltransferase family 4 protein [Rhodoferax sp.]
MKAVVMIGPCPDAKGGMASVVAVYRANGLFASGDCRYLTTATEGHGLRKLVVAASSLLRFFALLLAGRVALLHVHGASHGSFWRKFAFMRLARLFSVPVIFHLHGGEFRQFVDQRLGSAVRQRVVDTLAACRLIYCLNEEVGDWLRTLVPGAVVQVMPNPIDLRAGAASHAKRAPCVLFLGRLEREKGVFDLVRAVAAIAHQVPGIRLTLCGAGSAGGDVEQLAIQNGIGHLVDFPGWVDGEVKADLLRRAGVFVLPSYAEGMPMAVLEAMAARTPVVASRVGAVANMLEDGASGFIVEPGNVAMLGDAILAALTDGKTTHLMTERAAVRVRTLYAADVVIERLRQRYSELSA